ncbi:hypothetical protein D3C71_1901650 [compost metagenome]
MQARDRVRAEGHVRARFQHHAVLVGLGEDGRDLALPERVVQRIGDGLHADAQARRGDPIDHHVCLQPLVLQIAGDVGQRRCQL